MKKKITTVMGLVLTLMLLFTFTVSTFTATAATSTTYDQYLADYLATDSYAQSYINHEYLMPYRKCVEDMNNSVAFQTLLLDWEILTFGGKAVDQTEKVAAYYETILYDTICGDLAGESILNNLTSNYKSIKASTWKSVCKLIDGSSEMALKDTKNIVKGSQEYTEWTNAMKASGVFTEAFDYLGDATDFLETASNVEEAYEKICKVEALGTCKNQLEVILTDMSSSTNDPALIAACTEMVLLMDDAFANEEVFAAMLGEMVLSDCIDKVLSKVWEGVVENLIAQGFGFAIKAGQNIGKLLANTLFSTDEYVEHYFSMKALYKIEDIMVSLTKQYQKKYLSSKSEYNAQLYNESVKLLMKIYVEGVDYSKKYAQILNEKGMVTEIWTFFKSKDSKKEYQKLLDSFDGLRETFESIYSFFENVAYLRYEDYLAEQQDDVTSGAMDAISTDTTQADVDNTISRHQLITDVYSNRTVSANWTLTKDEYIYGNLIVNGGIVNLNGYTLTVGGGLIQNGGSMLIGGGTLNVNGDYNINTVMHTDEKNNTTTVDSSGKLYMYYESDRVNVHGDFTIASNGTCEYTPAFGLLTCATYHNYFNEGVLSIGGNFYQYNGNPQNFQPSNNFKLVFIGRKTHYFVSESNSTKTGNIVLMNGEKLVFKGCLNGLNNIDKMTYSSDNKAVSADNNTITATNVGTDTVTITDSDGNKATISITVNEYLTGDVNCDGEVSVADAVLLQKWILGIPNVYLPYWQFADLFEDNRIDVFDLVFLKRKLIYG